MSKKIKFLLATVMVIAMTIGALTSIAVVSADTYTVSDLGDSSRMTIQSTGDYPFTVEMVNGALVGSTACGGVNSGVSTMTVTANVAGLFVFEYEGGSEQSYDWFSIKKGTTSMVNQDTSNRGLSGASHSGVWKEASFEVIAGDVITFEYKKDSSGNSNGDIWNVRGLCIISSTDIVNASVVAESNGSVSVSASVGTIAAIQGGYSLTAASMLAGYTITATADEGYVFTGWKMQGSSDIASYENPYVVKAREDLDFVATFDIPLTVDVTVNDATKGSVTGNEGVFSPTETVTLTATATEGNIFYRWTDSTGKVLGYQTTYSFDILANTTVKAEFVSDFEGEGTQDTPYLIKTAEDLVLLSALVNNASYSWSNTSNVLQGSTYSKAYYLQTADIDMSGITDFEGIGRKNNHTFIYSFRGHYDGGGYSIRNMTIKAARDADGRTYAGLFNYVYSLSQNESTSFKNLTLINATVTSNTGTSYSYLSALIAYAQYSVTIDNVHILNGYVVTDDTSFSTYAGGLLAYNYSVSSVGTYITNCTVSGTIQSGRCVGGFLGSLESYNSGAVANISKCINYANVKANYSTTDYVGGFAGYYYLFNGEGTLQDCINLGTISSTNLCGAIVGNANIKTPNYGYLYNSGIVLQNGTPANTTLIAVYPSGTIPTMEHSGYISPDGYGIATFAYSDGTSISNIVAPTATVSDNDTTLACTPVVQSVASVRYDYMLEGNSLLGVKVVFSTDSIESIDGLDKVNGAYSLPIPAFANKAYVFRVVTDGKLDSFVTINLQVPGISQNIDSGFGTEEKPYIIDSQEDFADIALNTSAWYQVANDITFSGNVEPLLFAFPGVLDGNGKTLYNLNFVRNGYYTGLFASIDGGKVFNLNFDGVTVSSNGSYFGVLASLLRGSSVIDGITVRNLNVTLVNVERAGGVVGYTEYGGIIKNCSVEGTIVAQVGYVGGILGYCNSSAYYLEMVDNINFATIVGGADSQVGGIIGRSVNAHATSIVRHNLNIGNVSGGTVGAIYGANTRSTALPVNNFNASPVGGDYSKMMGSYSDGSTLLFNRYVGDAYYPTLADMYIALESEFGVFVTPIPTFALAAGGSEVLNGITDLETVYINDMDASVFFVDFSAEDGVELYYKGQLTTSGFELTDIAEIGETVAEFVVKKANCLDNTVKLTIKNEGIAGSSITKGFGNEERPYEIETAQNLQDIKFELNAHYLLNNDIDLNGVAFSALGTWNLPFSGVLDGGGHKIINLSASTDIAHYQDSPISAFMVSFAGTMKDLTFDNSTMTSSHNYNYAATVIIGRISSASIGIALLENVHVINSKTTEEKSGSAYNSILIGVVGIGGNITLRGCTVGGAIDGGKSSAFINTINNDADVTFDSCVNYTEIYNYSEVAGFVHNVNNAKLTFVSCANLGKLNTNKNQGSSIAAFVYLTNGGTVSFTECYSLAPVLINTGAYATLLFVNNVTNDTVVTRDGCYYIGGLASITESGTEEFVTVGSDSLMTVVSGTAVPEVPDLVAMNRLNYEGTAPEVNTIEAVAFNIYSLRVDNTGLFENESSLYGLEFIFDDASHIKLYKNGSAISPVGNTITLSSFNSGDSLFFAVQENEKGRQTFVYITFYSAAGGIAGATHITKGQGTASDPYIIDSVDALFEAANYPSYNYKVVVMSGNTDITNETTWTLTSVWKPIGSSANPFKGGFDGNGITIKNVTVNAAGSNYKGFFGYTAATAISNLNIEINVTGEQYVGGLIGIASAYTAITNCTVKGSVTGTVWVGGIVGGALQSKATMVLNNVTSYADVAGQRCVGGILNGYYATSTLDNVFVEGTVSLLPGEKENYPYWGTVNGYGAYTDVVMTNSGQRVTLTVPTGSDIAEIKLFNSNKSIDGLNPTFETIGATDVYTFDVLYDDVSIGRSVSLDDLDKLTSETNENGIVGNYSGFTIRIKDSDGYYRYITTLDRTEAKLVSTFGSQEQPFDLASLTRYEDNFANITVDTSSALSYIYKKSDTESIVVQTFATLLITNANDFEHLSKIIAGGIPTVIGGREFTMRTVATLKIKLMDNIDLTRARYSSSGTLLNGTSTDNIFNQFYGFGSSEFSPYRGSINGNGYTLTVNMDFPNAYAMGIIAIGSAYNRTQTVENLTVEGVISANCKVGIVGLFDNYEPSMVARGAAISMTNVKNMAKVSGVRMTGGMIGYVNNGKSITLTDCVNYGRIIGIGNGYGVGGLIGDLLTCRASSATFINCSNYGVIISAYNVDGVGGFVGQSGGTLVFRNKNYSFGGIYANNSSNIGGIVGKAELSGVALSIQLDSGSKLFNLGVVTGKTNVGGIIGSIVVTLNTTVNFDMIRQYADIWGSVSGKVFGIVRNGSVTLSNSLIECRGTLLAGQGSAVATD